MNKSTSTREPRILTLSVYIWVLAIVILGFSLNFSQPVEKLFCRM